MTEDYFEKENDLTRFLFDLEQVLAFQLEHEVQVIRGDDYQYHCWIDKKAYGTALTPMFALAWGIQSYKSRQRV